MEPRGPKPVDPVVAALNAEGARFRAEEDHRETKAAPPPPPGPTAAEHADAAATAALLVTLVDLAMTALVSEKLKLSRAEQSAISEKAEPVIRLYLPPEMFLGPVGALAMTAGAIYAAKFLAPDPTPPASGQTVEGTATATPTPEVKP